MVQVIIIEKLLKDVNKFSSFYNIQMTQHLSEVVKLLAINYYKNNDLTQQEVANIFNVTKRTLQNWLNAYENNTLSKKI